MKLKFADNTVKNHADPFMYQVENGWAMYVTSQTEGVKAFSSDSPFGVWKYEGVVCSVDGCRGYWAPCVIYLDGWYYLYFSCSNDHMCEYLHVAKSKSPFGPFEDIHCMYDHFSIDAHVVQTNEGLFLWYAQDVAKCERAGTRIYVERLLDPYTPDGNPIEKIVPTMDEEISDFRNGADWHTVEGPFWLEHEGYQYVMYSGACYANDSYHIGYVTAKSSDGDLTKVEYEKHTNDGCFSPLLMKDEFEEGQGHNSVIFYNGEYYAVYHGRDYDDTAEKNTERRTARICKLHIHNGIITAERL